MLKKLRNSFVQRQLYITGNGFFCCGILLLLLFPAALFAAQIDHQPLVTRDDLSFQSIFVLTLENTPEILETPIRELQAEQFSATGESWIAGRPSLQLNYYNDRIRDNVGMSELEYGVQLPLWWPGQRRDTRSLGNQYEAQVDTWKQALKWVVAGRLRESLADIFEAELGLALQVRSVEEARRLHEITQTFFNVGEVARLDLMQAESLLVEKQAELIQAEAALVDAEITYAILTGLDERPSQPHIEALTQQEDITESHPQLRYLRSSVNLAGETVRQSENAARGNPSLTIGSRREKTDRFNDSLSSVGIQLNIPFGGSTFVSAQSSNARRSKVNAEVAYQNAFVQLTKALHEVEHDLFILVEEEPLRRAQSEISQQRYAMALTAFEVGESTLAQVVLAQQEAQVSERTLQLLLLERQRLITEFNQIIGEVP